MKPQHLNPEEAVQMHFDIGATQSYAMHWGTFQLAAESLAETHADYATALARHSLSEKTFSQLKIGETRISNQRKAK